ncbi:hypothetical protein GUJ93_ZPchr0011g27122 [Zizania palustris]|uniref:Bifunctional inhibitor/plant lipid transfer protein/seed storage helical domain-containing protein n=1 Tax=Zizania palustris TaxID=103762 RepID=A0A8J5WJ81_ZIZPA|nr:hypothetical protein GUJ93_ZPchr0011g27122 [Zizania palustris]
MAVATAAAADRCGKDLDELMGSCEGYLSFPAEPRVAPSTACCGVVRKVDVPCLCTMVTPEVVEQYISMDKAGYVAGYCRRPFVPASYGGSYHIPGPMA